MGARSLGEKKIGRHGARGLILHMPVSFSRAHELEPGSQVEVFEVSATEPVRLPAGEYLVIRAPRSGTIGISAKG